MFSLAHFLISSWLAAENLDIPTDNSRVAPSFTMTAFTDDRGRQTRIFGTKGQITGDSQVIQVVDFLTDKKTEYDLSSAGNVDNTGGHGGGDYNLIRCFVDAVRNKDQSLLLSGPDETLASHRMVFAAEKARVEHRVVEL